MHVNRLRAISCHILDHLVFLVILWNYFFQMFGALHPIQLEGKNYYASFIDDYNKFTWIYLLKFKLDVFQKFNEFQGLVERLFN